MSKHGVFANVFVIAALGAFAVGAVFAYRGYWSRPVAALGLIVCGKVQEVTVVMRDGTLKRFTGPSLEARALIEKVPDENYAAHNVTGAFCAPRVY